jgi:general nucleoside transport system permease protein
MNIEDIFTIAFFVTWISAGIRLAIPVLLAALGDIFNELSGILNIAIEGTMLIGALAGFLAAFYTQSTWLGMLAGTITGLVFGLFLAWMFINVQADQVVVGIVFNIFALGLTSMVYRAVMGITTVPPQVPMFKTISVPILSDIPILGPILFRHNIFVYIVIALVIIGGIVIYRTKLGLAIRAVGEHPRAADTAGISVTRIRYLCMIIASSLAGMAGALLVLGQLGLFRDNVTAGRGFIALAIVIFGRWNPYVAIGAGLAFGAADALSMSLQMFDIPIPPQFLLMLPYLITAIVMSGLTGKVIGPAYLLEPYSRE